MRHVARFSRLVIAIGLSACASPATDTPDTAETGSAETGSADTGSVDTKPSGHDEADGTDGTDGSTPDVPGSCDLLGCPTGATCVEGACVFDGEAPCAPMIERHVVPEFATSPQGIAATDTLVAVSGAIGLELYDPAATAAEVPVPLGYLELDGVGLDVSLDGALAAVAHGADGVTLVDVSDPTSPRAVATIPSYDAARGVALVGDRLAVADGVAGVRLYDVSTPTSPVALGTVALDQPAAGVALAGDVVYVAAHTLGLVVVDFSGTPTITASLPIDGGDALRVHVAAGRAWVAAGYAGLRIFDLSSPTTPAPVATYFVGGNMIMATDVAVDVPSQRAYVADFWRQVTVLDLAPVLTGAPTHDPVAITSAKDSGYTQGIAVSAGRAWVAGDPLEVFDITGDSPQLLHRFGRRAEYAIATPLELDEAGRVLVTNGQRELRVMAPDGDGYTTELTYTSEYGITSVTAQGETAYVGVDTTQPMTATSDLEVVDLGAAGGPTRLGSLHLSGRLQDLVLAGDGTLYATNGTGLLIIDVTDRAAPTLAQTVTTSWYGDTLAMAGDRLAVFSRYRGVDFYDVTDRLAPKHLGSYETGNTSGSVTIDDARAYVGYGDAVVVLDLTADASDAAPGMAVLSELMTDGLVRDVALDGETLWILSGTRILVASVDAGTGTLSPIAAVPSPGRAPVSLRVRGGVVLASDKVEPLLRLSLGCTSATVTYAATGTPSAGAQWVDLATGAAALTVADDADALLTVGYLQGTAPAAVTASAPVLAWKGAAVSEPIVDVGDELVVATGKAAHPRVIRAARMGAPTADRVRLRAVNAVVGAEVTASLHRVASGPGPLPATGASVWPLGALALGAHGPALDLSATGRLELWATASDRSLVAPLPGLEAGHAHDLIVGTSAAGELIALVVRDDGLTSVVAGPSYVTRLRVANLTGKALAVALEGEAVAEFEALASLESSTIATVRPGSKRLVAKDAESGAIVFEQPVLPTQVGEQATFVLYDGPSGVSGTRLTDFTGQQTGDGTTEVQLVNASNGTLNATLLGVDGPEFTGSALTLASDLPAGGVSLKEHPHASSYALGVDADRDGTSEKIWDVGYFPDYGFNLFIARDATGRLRVGSQSPADVPIDWREARDDLTTVRVMNLTGQSGLTFTVQPWHSAPPVTDVIAQDGGTYAYQLRAGAQTVTLTNAATAKSWTWSGELAGDTAHTIAFWKSPAGPVASLSLQDRPAAATGSAVRFINTNSAGGTVTAWFAATETGDGALLGTAAPGEGTKAWNAGGDGAVANGWIRVDRDGDGEADLRFALGSSGLYRGVTNVFWVQDATWPYLVVQGADYLTTTVYAEELQARLRIVTLPTTQSSAMLRLDDGAPFALYGKGSYGTGVTAFVGYWESHSVVAGTHTLTLGEPGAETALTHDFPSESKTLLVLYGEPDHLSVLWLDETGLDGEGRTATVINTNATAAGLYTTTDAEGAGWTPVITTLAPGAVSDTLAIDTSAAFYGVDWGADGTVDWQNGDNIDSGHEWVFLTASEPGKPLIVSLSGAHSAWIWGELVP